MLSLELATHTNIHSVLTSRPAPDLCQLLNSQITQPSMPSISSLTPKTCIEITFYSLQFSTPHLTTMQHCIMALHSTMYYDIIGTCVDYHLHVEEQLSSVTYEGISAIK